MFDLQIFRDLMDFTWNNYTKYSREKDSISQQKRNGCFTLPPSFKYVKDTRN